MHASYFNDGIIILSDTPGLLLIQSLEKDTCIFFNLATQLEHAYSVTALQQMIREKKLMKLQYLLCLYSRPFSKPTGALHYFASNCLQTLSGMLTTIVTCLFTGEQVIVSCWIRDTQRHRTIVKGTQLVDLLKQIDDIIHNVAPFKPGATDLNLTYNLFGSKGCIKTGITSLTNSRQFK